MRAALSAGVLSAVVLGSPLAAQTPSKHDAPAALAEVNGIPITSDEVNKSLGMQLAKLEEQIYQIKMQRVDALINEKLLAAEAAKRGISQQALIDAEVTSKVSLVTEQEIDAYYQRNRAQFPNVLESAAKDPIRARLQGEKLAARRQVLLQTLRSQAKVAVHLTPPPVYRTAVSIDGARFRGPQNAPVTIVEFSDYHCPFCKRAEDTVAAVLSRYGDKVKLVFKDFPIEQLHPRSKRAHEAARCAAEQGKFWDYHKLLFAGSPQATPDEFKASARAAGLSLPAFEQCLAETSRMSAIQREIQKEIDDGRRLGVSGTPAFFINGRFLSGAQPLDSFVRIIDDELSRGAQLVSRR